MLKTLLFVTIASAYLATSSFGQKADMSMKPDQEDIFSRWFGSEYDLYNKMHDKQSEFGYNRQPYEKEYGYNRRPSEDEYQKQQLEQIYEKQRERDAILRRRHNPKFQGEYGPACKRETSCEDICNYFFPERTSKNCAQEVSWGVTKCKCTC